jgi:hypothetical protein
VPSTKVSFNVCDNVVDKLSDEPGLEFKDEVVYPDGTVYKGQVKDDKRHGYGI